MPVMMRTAISLVSKDKAGQASGLVSIGIQIGSVTGGAVIGTLFFNLIPNLGFKEAFVAAVGMIGIFQLIGIGAGSRLKKFID
jgi:predicted MFS family arabinose efflux permease